MVNKKNSIRITGGFWKRTIVPFNGEFLVRPTPGRVRETVFNWIRQDRDLVDCTVLDLFCGSGVLGLEALSRGAKSVSFVDKNKTCLLKIEGLLHKLKASQKVEFINEEVLIWLDSDAYSRYDLVFLDPPFSLDNPMIYLSKVKPFVKKDGLIYLEIHQSKTTLPDSGVECLKSGKAGIIYFGLYRIL